MARARFWTGVVMMMCPVAGMAITNCGELLEPWPSVRGRVMYKGRPLRSGVVVFFSENPKLSSDMRGDIDRDGCFSASPYRWHVGREPARFRIQLFPDPRESRKAAPPRPVADLRLASIGLMAAPAPSPTAEMPSQSGRSEYDTEGLEVSLRSEPVRIEIDLRD